MPDYQGMDAPIVRRCTILDPPEPQTQLSDGFCGVEGVRPCHYNAHIFGFILIVLLVLPWKHDSSLWQIIPPRKQNMAPANPKGRPMNAAKYRLSLAVISVCIVTL